MREVEQPDLVDWTGGEVWAAGEALAWLLAAPGSPLGPVVGNRVLELGCGCGLVGLAAVGIGASQVVLTNQVTIMAQRNLERNFAGEGRAEVRRLEWGDAVVVAALAPPFDLILAGDVVYVSDNFAALRRPSPPPAG